MGEGQFVSGIGAASANVFDDHALKFTRFLERVHRMYTCVSMVLLFTDRDVGSLAFHLQSFDQVRIMESLPSFRKPSIQDHRTSSNIHVERKYKGRACELSEQPPLPSTNYRSRDTI